MPTRARSKGGAESRSARGAAGRPPISIAAGLAPLHVVEPLLADADWRREFEQAVRGAGGSSTTILVPETSPAAVVRLGEAGARWSFAFIDGDHDGDAPTQDALACAPYLETTAMVVFHDLVSPHVAAGLRALGGERLERDGVPDGADDGRRLARRDRACGAQARPHAALGSSRPSGRNSHIRRQRGLRALVAS